MKLLTKKRPKNIFLTVEKGIRARILEGDWSDEPYLPSENELATEWKVSRPTVRKALQNLVSEGLLYRLPGTGTVVRGSVPPAHGRERISTKLFGLVVPYINDPANDAFFAHITRGCESAARTDNCHIIFSNSQDDPAQEKNCLRSLVSRGVDGVILFYVGGCENLPLLTELQRNHIPLVLIDRRPEHFRTNFVGVDNFAGAYEATKHLIGLGHKRIAFIRASPPVSAVAERVAGFQKAMADAGLTIPDRYLTVPNSTREKGGHEAAGLLLSGGSPPTAVLAVNDTTAIGFMREARRLGYRTPRDISVVGFDNLPAAWHCETPLTTVAQPLEEIGRQAFLILRKICSGGVDSSTEEVVLKTHLEIRKSTSQPNKSGVTT